MKSLNLGLASELIPHLLDHKPEYICIENLQFQTKQENHEQNLGVSIIDENFDQRAQIIEIYQMFLSLV